MKKLVTLVSDVGFNFWLCCMAALMLTACGGGASDKNEQAPQFAAQSTNAGAVPTPASDPTREEQLRELYWWILGREPDATGLQFWLQSSLRPEQIELLLKRSPELDSQLNWSSIGAKTENKIYVDAAATGDKADGSERNPFKTLAAAAKAVKPSTTVYVKPGIYEGGFRTATNGAASVGGKDGGIYFVSTLRWGAKIVPASSSTNEFDNTTAWTNAGDYVHIIGFEVDGSLSSDSRYDNWRQGIYTSGTRSVIRDNYVHDVARWYTCSSGLGGAAINLDAHKRGGLSDAVSNWVRDIGKAGQGCNRVQGIYASSSGSVINNVVYRVVSGAAIHLYHEANNVKVINNTVAASNVGVVIGAGGYRGQVVENKDSCIYNNIAYDNYIGIQEYVSQGGVLGVNHYRNNLVAKNTRNWDSMRNPYIETKTGDPSFIDYSTNKLLPNFHIGPRSAAISNGTAELALQETDFDGRKRAMSIGAYEYQTTGNSLY
jgi:hypothetical protein